MTMRATPDHDPWRIAWRLATKDSLLAATLLTLALFLLGLALLPQIPPDPMTIGQWLAQTQVHLGDKTQFLYRLGLLSLADSPLLRLLLAFTAFLLLVRTAALAESLWHSRGSNQQSSRDVPVALAHVGALLFLLGLLIEHLWGWQADGLIGHAGDLLSVPGHGEIGLESTPSGVRSARRGTIVYVTGDGPELTARAYDTEKGQLSLQRTVREPPTPELTVALLPEAPEAPFAVPDANLVVRISLPPQTELTAAAPLRLQVFRAPLGDLIQETNLQGETERLTVNGVELELHRSSYLTLTAVRDPGRWLKGVGLVLGTTGLLSLLAWPQRPARLHKLTALIARLPSALLALAIVGLALRNMTAAGAPWDRSPLQTELTAVGLAALAAWMLRRPDRGRAAQMRDMSKLQEPP